MRCGKDWCAWLGHTALVGALSAFATACGGVDPAQACEDYLDAVVEGLEACGYPASELSAARGDAERSLGGCSNVASIRDEDELYGSCLPSLRNLDCDDVAAGELVIDSSCNDQLELP